MPFTLSHPAAILPIYAWSKSRLPFAALAIGSMSPDFAYFMPYELGKTSHTLFGIFAFCWPIGMLAWGVFEYLLKRPTLALMPAFVRAHCSSNVLKPSAILFLLVSVSLIVGAATHIAWDAFTHATSPLVAAFPLLRATVFEFRGAPVPAYKLLQHVSTIVGLVAIATWLFFQRTTVEDDTSANERDHSSNILSIGWRVGALAAMFSLSLGGAALNWVSHPSSSIERQLFYLAIGGMAGFALSWCGIAIIVRAVYAEDIFSEGAREP